MAEGIKIEHPLWTRVSALVATTGTATKEHAALQAVLVLHRPIPSEVRADGLVTFRCTGCDMPEHSQYSEDEPTPAPCTTLVKVADAMGVSPQ